MPRYRLFASAVVVLSAAFAAGCTSTSDYDATTTSSVRPTADRADEADQGEFGINGRNGYLTHGPMQ